ncbi:DUF4340 domain-containing protein [Candidatus Methylacidithermus pantelleriae]|nr:DUF4340 domain-containing protein [Candidatus Methylacidithermus pantelleriae]
MGFATAMRTPWDNFRSSLILLTLALALFSYIYLVERHQKSTEEIQRSEQNLFDVVPEKVQWLRITNAQGTITLQRQGSQWLIVEPIRTEADESAVDRLLMELEILQTRRKIRYEQLPDGENTLKQWGLENPVLRLEFRTDSNVHTLVVGRKTAVSDLVYARASLARTAPVHLINASSLEALNKKLDDLRSRVVLKFDPMTVRSFGVQETQAAPSSGIAKEWEVGRIGERWSIQKPLVCRADKDQVETWLNRLYLLRVKKFVSDEPAALAPYGLDAPSAQIWILSGGEKNRLTLLIGSATKDQPDEVYAKLLKGSGIFTLSKNAVTEILEGFSQLRDRHVLPPLDWNKLSELEIKTSNVSLELSRHGDGWIVQAPTHPQVDGARVETLLSHLRDLQARDFVEGASPELVSYGFETPTATVALTFSKGSSPERLSIFVGKEEKGDLYCKNSLEPFVYRVSSELLKVLPHESWEWRKPSVFSFRPEEIRSLSLSATDGRSVHVRKKDNGLFVADGSSVSPEKLAAQLDHMCQWKAVRWMALAQVQSSLENPQYRLVIQTNHPVTVRVSPPGANGSRTALIEGDTAAFELSQSDAQLLEELLAAASPATSKAALAR